MRTLDEFNDICRNGNAFEVNEYYYGRPADLPFGKINWRDERGLTPIMWAAMMNRNFTVIGALAKMGADLRMLEPWTHHNLITLAALNNENHQVVSAVLGAMTETKDTIDMIEDALRECSVVLQNSHGKWNRHIDHVRGILVAKRDFISNVIRLPRGIAPGHRPMHGKGSIQDRNRKNQVQTNQQAERKIS
jgi:hypothetical protein